MSNANQKVVLGSTPTTYIDVAHVARYKYQVEFDDCYRQRVNNGRRIVDSFIQTKRPFYGTNTGYGDNVHTIISDEDMVLLQVNCIRASACTVGEPFNEEAVRAMMFVMLAQLGMGNSGIHLDTMELVRTFLNKGLYPYVPQHGSVGYLNAEAHIALTFMGEGKLYDQGQFRPAAEVLAKHNIPTMMPRPKEGLCLTSGTTSVTALSSLAVYDFIMISKTADISAALSIEALASPLMAYDPRLIGIRPHAGQLKTANNLRRMLSDSQIMIKEGSKKVQESLSIRCIPQVHGSVKEALNMAAERLNIELNSTVDNPVVVFEDNIEEVLMGCNCDGTYIGYAADMAAVAAVNIAKMTERRIDRLLNRHVSGLPGFLIKNVGVNNGMMMCQYTAAGIVAEMRIKSHPATVDSIPTCAFQEDYVSMGYNAALKAYESAQLFKYIPAIEIITSMQSYQFHRKEDLSAIARLLAEKSQEIIPYFEADCNFSEYMEDVAAKICEGFFLDIVEEAIGKLEF